MGRLIVVILQYWQIRKDDYRTQYIQFHHAAHFLLWEPVIDHLDLLSLAVLLHDNLADISPLAVDHLEPPDLHGSPAALGIDVLDRVVQVESAVGARGLVGPREPPLRDPGAVLLDDPGLDVLLGDELGEGLAVAKQPVRVLADLAVQGPVLLGRAELGRRLHRVDVHHVLRGRAGRAGRRLVLLDVYVDCGQADGLADEEAYAL